MKTRRATILFATFLVASATQALAQGTPPTAADGSKPSTDATGPGTLSEKLSQSGGVIHPTGNVDPKMDKAAPVPHPNSTPVITPPGTEGNGGTEPK